MAVDDLSMFGKCHYAGKDKLFKSFCMAAYGSQLWDWSVRQRTVSSPPLQRKGVCRILGLPRTTHRALLHLISGDLSVIASFTNDFSFFSTVVSIAITNVLNCVPSLLCMAARAPACQSLNFVCQKYEICKYSIASEGRGVYHMYA